MLIYTTSTWVLLHECVRLKWAGVPSALISYARGVVVRNILYKCCRLHTSSGRRANTSHLLCDTGPGRIPRRTWKMREINIRNSNGGVALDCAAALLNPLNPGTMWPRILFEWKTWTPDDVVQCQCADLYAFYRTTTNTYVLIVSHTENSKVDKSAYRSGLHYNPIQCQPIATRVCITGDIVTGITG